MLQLIKLQFMIPMKVMEKVNWERLAYEKLEGLMDVVEKHSNGSYDTEKEYDDLGMRYFVQIEKDNL